MGSVVLMELDWVTFNSLRLIQQPKYSLDPDLFVLVEMATAISFKLHPLAHLHWKEHAL